MSLLLPVRTEKIILTAIKKHYVQLHAWYYHLAVVVIKGHPTIFNQALLQTTTAILITSKVRYIFCNLVMLHVNGNPTRWSLQEEVLATHTLKWTTQRFSVKEEVQINGGWCSVQSLTVRAAAWTCGKKLLINSPQQFFIFTRPKAARPHVSSETLQRWHFVSPLFLLQSRLHERKEMSHGHN